MPSRSSRWVRLDLDYFRHPRPMAAGAPGRALHLASICWAAAQLTDGHLPAAAIPSILHDAGVQRSAIDRVEAAGLWLPNGDGYEISGYLDRNPSRESVEAEREAWRKRQRRARGREDGEGEVTP